MAIFFFTSVETNFPDLCFSTIELNTQGTKLLYLRQNVWWLLLSWVRCGTCPGEAHNPVKESDLHVNNSCMRLTVIKSTSRAMMEGSLCFSYSLGPPLSSSSILTHWRYIVFPFSYILIAVSLLEITNPCLNLDSTHCSTRGLVGTSWVCVLALSNLAIMAWEESTQHISPTT